MREAVLRLQRGGGGAARSGRGARQRRAPAPPGLRGSAQHRGQVVSPPSLRLPRRFFLSIETSFSSMLILRVFKALC